MSSKNTNLYDHPHLKNNINFCVSCGSKLIFRSWIEGDSSKQLCCSKTNCNYVHFLDPKLATGVITLLDNKLILLKDPITPEKTYGLFQVVLSIEVKSLRKPQKGKFLKKLD